jgi:hypothetical protein
LVRSSYFGNTIGFFSVFTVVDEADEDKLLRTGLGLLEVSIATRSTEDVPLFGGLPDDEIATSGGDV